MHIARICERSQIQFQISRSFRPRNPANLGSEICFWISEIWIWKQWLCQILRRGNKLNYGLYESSDYKRCKVCIKLSYLMDNLVPRSPRSCVGLRKWKLRDRPMRCAQEGPLKLPDERQSLKRKENWWKLLLLGIQTGDKLAKPPFFVAYSRLCRHCRNLAEGGCRLSRFHFRLCRYFLGHVACRNLPWQGLWFCHWNKLLGPLSLFQTSCYCRAKLARL